MKNNNLDDVLRESDAIIDRSDSPFDLTSLQIFNSILSTEEVNSLLRDKSTPPELYVEAAYIKLNKIFSNHIYGSNYSERHIILDILTSKQTQTNSVADKLFPYVEILLNDNSSGLVNKAQDFIVTSNISYSILEDFIIKKVLAWDISLISILEILSRKVQYLAVTKRLPLDSDKITKLVSIIEKVLLSDKANLTTSEDVNLSKIAKHAETSLYNIIFQMYPAISLPLLDKAIYLKKTKDFDWGNLDILTSESICSEERINKLLNLRQLDIDEKLLKNPNIGLEKVWHIYTRYSQENPKILGNLFMNNKDIISHIIKTKFSSAILGYIEQFATVSELDEKYKDITISKDIIEDIYSVVVSDIKKQEHINHTFAQLVYNQLGPDKASVLLKSKDDNVATFLFDLWKVDSPLKNNKLLQAFTTYPRQHLRLKLMEQFDSDRYYWQKTPSVDLNKVKCLSETDKILYRDSILPILVKDKATVVRDFAVSILPLLSEGVNAFELALKSNRPGAINEYIKQAKAISDEIFDICLEKGYKILSKLSQHNNLTALQQQKLLDLGFDDVTRNIISVNNITDKKILNRVREVHGTTLDSYLSTLDIWNKEERINFIKNGDSKIRMNIAKHCHSLEPDEVVLLLQLSANEYYTLQSLNNNASYKKYINELYNIINNNYEKKDNRCK